MTKNNNYKFWQDFKAIVEQNSISPKAAEWYLKWAKAFENALPHISLHERTKNDVKAYLDTLIRRGNLEDWQINQANHSLCLLFEHFLDLKWANPWPDFLPNNDDTQSDHGQIRKNEIRFKDIPKKPLGDIGPYQHAQKKRRVPVVLTVEEKDRVLTEMKGMYALMAGIIYGSGLRLMECVRLRVKDVDFAQRQIVVRNGKGGKDRVTVLPDKYADTLQQHLAEVKKIHESDLSKGYGEVYLWPSPERKYKNFAKEWGWQYVFPATKLSVDPMGGKVRRHHISESSLILMISSVSKSDWGCPQMNFWTSIPFPLFRDNPYFPSVMLKMSDAEGYPCTFLSDDGCKVYKDRPFSCRTYPLEPAVARGSEHQVLYFLAKHSYCLGHDEAREWTVEEWIADQEMELYNRMNARWVNISI